MVFVSALKGSTCRYVQESRSRHEHSPSYNHPETLNTKP